MRSGSPGLAPISAAMRARRAGSILACATRITSSYDMRTARWRAVSRSRLPLGAGALVGEPDRRQPVEIEPRIGDVLIGDEPAHAFLDHVARGGRHHRDDLALELGERGGGAALAALRSRAARRSPARPLKAGAEAAQIGLDRLAVGADRALERLGRNRQPAAARDRAEHHRVDDRAAAARDLLHVEQDVPLRVLLDRLRQAAPNRSGRRPSRSSRRSHRSARSTRS